MCTNIATTARVAGSAKTAAGWSAIDEATVAFDHATQLWTEHALRLDFAKEGGDRVAVELDLDSGRALLRKLQEVIRAADASGVET